MSMLPRLLLTSIAFEVKFAANCTYSGLYPLDLQLVNDARYLRKPAATATVDYNLVQVLTHCPTQPS